MPISWLTAMLDVPDDRFEPARRFWEEATAMRVAGKSNRQDRAILVPSVGDAYLAMGRVSACPGGCRLVLNVDDPAGMSQRAVELGARVERHDSYAIEMHSPGGLPFIITAWGGESRRPPPASWPAGQRSLVDQVCIDIPPSTYDLECDFWAHITGAEPLPGGRPEFRYLPRTPGMPLRLLLQRLLDAPAGATSAHLDLACSDRAVEVRRHEALGATVAHEGPVWTTLRDPAAIAYCITDRDPDSGTLASNRP
jgi:Glyoxalase-like domain